MRLPGLDPDDLPDPKLVFDRHREPLEPPIFDDAEPRIFKPAADGELNPFDRVRLERAYVEVEDAAADTQIRKAKAAARIRERERSREAERLHRARELDSRLETEKWDREDRRHQRYTMLILLAVAALSTIAMAFLTLSSSSSGIRISPGAGASALVAAAAGLLLRASNGEENASVVDWLLQRKKGNSNS